MKDYFEVLDVPPSNPCYNCNPCMRIRLMELGFIPNQKIEIKQGGSDLFIVSILSDTNVVESTVALRKNELDRICLSNIIH